MSYTDCSEYSLMGCEARIFEARPCLNDFTCCGECDLTDECSWPCVHITNGKF